MKWYILIAALLVCGGLVFLGLSNRYYIDTSTKLKVDRLTGKTYELPNRNTPPPPTSTPEKTESPSNEEYIRNLELLKTHKDIYDKFKEYYNNVLTEYDKDPVSCKNGKMSTLCNLRAIKFADYSPFLLPEIIIAKYENGINTPDKFLDFVIEYHKSLKQ